LAFCYDLGISIELAFKVIKQSRKEFQFPLKLYHVVFNSIALTMGVLAILGKPQWSGLYGCSHMESYEIQ
jgi:hypothetical protein